VSGPAPTAKKGMPTWAIVLIVVGALGIVVVGLKIVTTVAIVVPEMQETQRRLSCKGNLSQLAEVFLIRRMQSPKVAPRSGPALFLEWRSTTSEIKRGQEKILVCPGDPSAKFPTAEADWTAWDRVDLDHAPRALCSYAVRDFARFPLPAKPTGGEPIAACIHHPGGAVVAFAAGDTEFVTLQGLGLRPQDEMTVGPDSKSPLLRVLRYGDGSVR
jgi:hypothetical protein